MRYMIDTNIIVYAKSGRHENIRERLAVAAESGETCISSITFAELQFGAFNSERPEQNRLALTLVLASLPILPFDDTAAVEYGKIRAGFRRAGITIGANDLLIAAHARSRGLTLVTHNVDEFSRVPGLMVEDWAL